MKNDVVIQSRDEKAKSNSLLNIQATQPVNVDPTMNAQNPHTGSTGDFATKVQTSSFEPSSSVDGTAGFTPMAICGMACRLPGKIHSPKELWDFLISKGDARTRVPESRYNVSAYHSPTKKFGSIVTDFGYFLDETVDLAALDTSFFPMQRKDLERLDPQQRLLLEVARESLDDAGEVNWRGSNVGVYVGNYGADWYDLLNSDQQRYGTHITTAHDFMLSNRLSYEMDLRGPR
jgi:acyl transferase domain-containing protein